MSIEHVNRICQTENIKHVGHVGFQAFFHPFFSPNKFSVLVQVRQGIFPPLLAALLQSCKIREIFKKNTSPKLQKCPKLTKIKSRICQNKVAQSSRCAQNIVPAKGQRPKPFLQRIGLARGAPIFYADSA